MNRIGQELNIIFLSAWGLEPVGKISIILSKKEKNVTEPEREELINY